jgi:hypothetical protein
MNIRVLPNELKELAVSRLQPYLSLPKVQDVINYMMAQDDSQYLQEFFDYNNTLDELRDQNFFVLVPEFKKYLKVPDAVE